MVKLLSVVVSVYNEELALREFYQETGAVLKALPSSWDYELLFVNGWQCRPVPGDPLGAGPPGQPGEGGGVFQEFRP